MIQFCLASLFQNVQHIISSELIGTAAGNDTKTFEIEFAIPEVPSSHVDADGIGIFYSIQVKVSHKFKAFMFKTFKFELRNSLG